MIYFSVFLLSLVSKGLRVCVYFTIFEGTVLILYYG